MGGTCKKVEHFVLNFFFTYILHKLSDIFAYLEGKNIMLLSCENKLKFGIGSHWKGTFRQPGFKAAMKV